MNNLLNIVGTHIKSAYTAQHDPARTCLQSDALRILGNEHPFTREWTHGELTDTDFHAKALKIREETARYYPDAQFQLGDSVRFEQKPVHVYGYIRAVDMFRGMFLYDVAFIDGDACRINEAHLHVWHTTPIQYRSDR